MLTKDCMSVNYETYVRNILGQNFRRRKYIWSKNDILHTAPGYRNHVCNRMSNSFPEKNDEVISLTIHITEIKIEVVLIK